MILKETQIPGYDNSGAILMKCIHIHGGFKQRVSKIGKIVTLSCIKFKPKKKKTF